MQRAANFVLGLLLGLGAGTLVTSMLAPRRGDETRELVRERGLELKTRAEDVVGRAQTIATETVARVRGQVEDLLRASGARSDNTTT